MSEEGTENKEITDDLEIIDQLKVLNSTKEKVWLWQNVGERTVYFALVKKIDQLRKLVQIHPTTKKGFHFASKENVYMYSQDKLVAMKLEIREIEKDYLVFSLPKKIMRVSESFVAGLQIVERENEGAHVHERTHDRNEIHGEKFVRVKPADENVLPLEYYLNDISQGGLSFRVQDVGEFHKGDKIEIVEMNGQPLEPVLKGEVMSIRELPAAGNFYKVGVRYI